ncbi:unnamed protein product [Tenebrio molitor]|nr:unnamed protein product [Tenebrio molitor]
MHTTRKTCHFYVTGICTTLERSTTNYVLFRTISMCKYSSSTEMSLFMSISLESPAKDQIGRKMVSMMSSWLWAHDGRGIV